MNWIIHFFDFIDNNKLIKWEDKTLLAVSGGVDSVAMAHMFFLAGLKFDIAHCNFKLRGDEADEDEIFCRKIAEKYNVSFFSNSFNTSEYSKEKGLSIQTAARELRYKWLEEVRKNHNLSLIATAHHLNDNAETMLFNIARGTGYAGISGIPVKNNHVIRPLMGFQKSEIVDFVNKHKLKYRTDSSNSSNNYSRNKIRNEVIPHLKDINPQAIKHFSGLSTIAQKTENLLMHLLEKEKVIEKKGSEFFIYVKKINNYPERETLLYHLIKDFGFSAKQTKLIKRTVKSQPGKYYESDSYKIIKDRDVFIITPKKENNITEIKIDPWQVYKLDNNLVFKSEIIDYMPDIEISKESNCCSIDYDKLKFPLILRKWEKGDAFHPFGMKGSKKISDFLIDIKMPLHKKEEVMVLESGNDIVWVVNHRPDNRYAIKPTTSKIFSAKIYPA